MKANKNKRRKIFVDKVSQSKYAATILLYLIVYTMIISFLVYLPTISVLGEENAPLEKKIEAANQFFFLETRYLPVVVLVMIAMGLHSITITHRFFGPIKRFKNALKGIADGKVVDRVFRRKGDYLKDFEDEFNNMINAINMRNLEITNITLKNYKLIDELKNETDDNVSKEKRDEKLEQIKCNLEEIAKLSINQRQ